MVGEQVVGVILGSFSLKPLEESLASLGLPGAALQLRQGPLSIGSWGDKTSMACGSMFPMDGAWCGLPTQRLIWY